MLEPLRYQFHWLAPAGRWSATPPASATGSARSPSSTAAPSSTEARHERGYGTARNAAIGSMLIKGMLWSAVQVV